MCDTLCVRHDAGMWFAKNSDRHPDEPQVVEWHPRRAAATHLNTQYLTIDDADAAAFCGSRPTWLWGCEHGVNEYGVAAGNEKIFTTLNPQHVPRGLLGMDIVRLVLERARDADHALDICTSLLEAHGQGGSGEPFSDEPYFSSFMLVDARGGWIVETSNRTWAARSVGTGTSLSNRVTLNTDWTRASDDIAPGTDFDSLRLPAVPTERADGRLATTRACVARGPGVSLDDLARTLRSHDDNGSGFSVCLHRPDFHAQTTASMIIDLRADEPARVWALLGNPCAGVYAPGAPAQLADVRQWHRFAALRDRPLGAVRAALDPVEAQLWANRASGYAVVDAALARLGV